MGNHIAHHHHNGKGGSRKDRSDHWSEPWPQDDRSRCQAPCFQDQGSPEQAHCVSVRSSRRSLASPPTSAVSLSCSATPVTSVPASSPRRGSVPLAVPRRRSMSSSVSSPSRAVLATKLEKTNRLSTRYLHTLRRGDEPTK